MNTDRVTRSFSGDKEKDELLIQRVVEKVLANNKFLDKIIAAINDRISGLDSKVKECEQKVVSLETKLSDAQNLIERQEQYSRANNPRIFGLPEKPGEDPKQDNSDSLQQSGSSPHRSLRTYNRWSPMEEGITLAWSDLSVYTHVKDKSLRTYKRIITGVAGAIRSGSLVALMGSSGAGKSTLMGALAHRSAGGIVVEGDILINGRPIGSYMRYLSGFMHQEDIFVGSLTVWEHMNMMARMKLDRRITERERKFKIYEILKQLGLSKCINTRIGVNGDSKVLSGGEKKRLAFATELLTDPPLLFCDEPTTGLDAYSAQKIVTMMNMMSAGGKTILCTIHQPSSEIFAMFSQVILLADGKIAFMGSTANAVQFFDELGYKCPNNYNPADFFIRTLALTPGFEETSKQTIKSICNQFAVSDYAKEVDVVVQYEFHMGRASEHSSFIVRSNFKEVFCWTKLSWLTYRSFIDILRNPTVQALRILQKIGIAIMVGLCYLGTVSLSQNGIQSVQGAIFLFVTENTFTPMYSVLVAFPDDIPLFLREYRSGLYPAGLYYISKIIAMLPGLIIEPVLFVTIAYWLSGLRPSLYAFTMSNLSAILTMIVATSCGIFFSNAFESVPNAMAWLVPFDYVLMVTSGLFINLNSLPLIVSWTKYLSWLMYSTEVLTIIQWDGVFNITCENSNPDLPCLTDGEQVLEKYSYSREHLARNLWNMIFLCLIFHVLGFLCLWRRTRRK
nr:Scarlet [Dorcus rectus]